MYFYTRIIKINGNSSSKELELKSETQFNIKLN